MSSVRIQIRRDTTQNWADYNPTLLNGEIGFDVNLKRLKVGNGSAAWNDLAYVTFDPDTMAKIPVANDEGFISASYIPLTGVSVDSANISTLYVKNTDNSIAGAADSLDVSSKSMRLRLDTHTTGDYFFDFSGGRVSITGNLAVSGNVSSSTTPAQNSHLTNKSYVDTQISNAVSTSATSVLTTAQGYATTAQSNAISSSNTYTDGKISTEVTNRNNAITTALTTAEGYTDTAITNLVNGAPSVLNTLKELADAIGDDKNFATTIATNIATAKSDAESYTDDKIATEVTDRNNAISAHTTLTTSVHGISDTANLVYTSDSRLSDTRTPTNNTVTTVKIVDANVTTAKIADSAVTTAKIADSAITSAKIADGTIVDADINASAAIATSKISGLDTALAAKAPLAGPTFTGTVTLPSTTSIGNVSATEIGYVDGVTSSIQTQIDSKLNLSGGTMTGALTLSGAPTQDLHAATKLYVDGVTTGINFHAPTKVATTANLSATYSNGTNGYGATLTADTNRTFSTVDGISGFSVGDRILVRAQTDAKQNGIYALTTVGSSSAPWVLTRAADADNNPNGEVASGDFTFVTSGNTYGSTGFILSGSGTFTLGTDNINYVQFNAAQAILAGTGLSKNGTTISIDETYTATKASVDLKAPINNPTFTGTITAPLSTAGYVTTTSGGVIGSVSTIPNNGLTNSTVTVGSTSISLGSSATSIAGLTSVTSTAFTGALTGNASTATTLQTTRAINGVNFDGSAAITIKAVNPSGLTIGTGLSGSSYDGSGAVTIAIDSTVATLAGTQTLTNKTLTSPVIGTIVNTGTLTLPTSTDTLIGKATTDVLTNKTYDTAGTGNVFKINGTQITSNTGTGANVLATSPSVTGLQTDTLSTTGNVTVGGNLTVSGTTTTINSTTLAVNDLNIEIGKVASPTDSTANGGGITLKGTTDKTIQWDSANSNWTSSEHWNIATGKSFKINNTSVLSATALGSTVTGSSLTSVGTIATGVWQGTAISATYIDSAIARLSSPTFTGTVTIPTATVSGSGTVAGTWGVTGQMTDHKSINAQAGSYTLVAGDDGKVITLSGGGTLTIPSATFAVGSQVTIIQTGTSQVTVAGSGVTVNGTPGLKLRAQHSAATAIQVSSGVWQLFGDLTA